MKRLCTSTVVILALSLMAASPLVSFAADQEGPVAARLRQLAEESAEKTPEEVQELGREVLAELTLAGITGSALNVGDHMPDFWIKDAQGEDVSSNDLMTEGGMVVVFYRGAWCPYCNLYLQAWQDYLPALEEAGVRLVAISAESPQRSLSVEEKNELAFSVLSDQGYAVSREFGLVYDVPEKLVAIFDSYGLNLAEYYGTEKAQLPLSATYVVNPKGVITYAFLEVDYKVRAEPADVVAAVERLK